MKSHRWFPLLLLLVGLCLWVAGAPAARAQAPAILDNGYRNVFGPGPVGTPGGEPTPVSGDPFHTGYRAQRQNGTAFGGFPVNGFGTLQTNTIVTQPPAAYNPAIVPYPKSNSVPGSGVTVIVELRSAIIGRPLVVFQTSYNFGSEIPPPTTAYRAEPLNWRLKTTVVTDSATGTEISRAVENAITGDGTTTATDTPVTGQTTTVTIGLNPQFYWSEHAQTVYATQPGTITIEWRESATTTARTETYVIASSPDKPERTIYWTENGFNGPTVEVPAGRLNAVNIIYNTLVLKEVVTPFAPWPSGVTDFTETDPLKKRYKTFFYENNLFHAYNVEGRLFVEYLGNQRGDGTNEQKGYEIVNIIKEEAPRMVAVELGAEAGQLPIQDANGNPVVLEPRILAGLGLGGQPSLHQQVSSGGTGITLYAIRETQPGVANAAKSVDNSVLVYWLETAVLDLKWPKQFLGYVQQWPVDPAQYSIYARPDSGGAGGTETALATAVPLDPQNNPALVYQDDPANAQALLTPENKFYTEVTQSNPTNRALLRFTRDDDIWFERVFSQLDPYYRNPSDLLSRAVTAAPDATGKIATGFTGISNVVVSNPTTSQPHTQTTDYTVNLATGVITLVNATITSALITFTASTVPFTTAPAPVNADIGARLSPAGMLPAADPYGTTAPVYVGFVHQASGTAFDVGAYRDPFVEGFDEAAKGAIIPVNALTGNDTLEVWWYRKSTPEGAKITGTYWPSFVQKYHLRWPAAPPRIVLSSNAGSGELPSLQATGEIYHQNDPTAPGYNPNEEHALMLNGRAWALRDDLNLTDSSLPYVLLHYTEVDQRPAMQVFQVTRGTFDYPAVAGRVLQSPMPLPLLPPPLFPDRNLASYEIPGVVDPLEVSTAFHTTDSAFAHYQKFTWTDRKGILWVYRGPHQGNQVAPAPSLRMRFFYQTLPGFHYPSLGFNAQPAVGTLTPYLRRGIPGAYVGDPVTGAVSGTPPAERRDQPMDVIFRPQWPDSAPELRVGETLTLPKVGLPQVRGQASAELIYQQSVAQDVSTAGMADRKTSARLFDPTRSKVYPLSATTLAKIPDSAHTSVHLGKTYFPNLPPHLSPRLYFDPAVGASGSLVFKGLFMNELFGEKYLQLNVMSAADLAVAKGLVSADDVENKPRWDTAIDGLATTVETFIEDPARRGTFIPLRDESKTPRLPTIVYGVSFRVEAGAAPLIETGPGADARLPILPGDVAEVFYSDTAVDSYAVSASGGGSGYVVLAVGNGRDTDFTPADNPVSLQVFKVAAPLYRGEMKVVTSQNPLDEKLTLQHTGDFAGHPEEYDFEWRYAPPVNGLPLEVYSFVRNLIVAGASDIWTLINNPVHNGLDASQDYTKYRSPGASVAGSPAVALPGQAFTINNGDGAPEHGVTLPNALLRRTFSATTRPLRLFLSMNLGTNDGAVVYLNNAQVAGYNAPGDEDTPTATVPATAPAFTPLPLVFEINPNTLVANATANNNVFTVELYTTADAGSTTTFNLRLEGSQDVETLTGWLPVGLVPAGPGGSPPGEAASTDSTRNDAASPPTTGIVSVTGKHRHTIQGTSILTLSDNYFIMRYRAKAATNAAYVANGGWSKWTEPQLAEGWIKRALAGLNPFQQRVKDLFNHQIDTSVSLVEQAGKRWQGDIALNLDNMNDSGLIEIYETILRRGKVLSIEGTPAISYGGANDALLLAAGYLSDLYMILGNEAYADAANSTIAFSTASAANFITQYGDVATSLFAFKGQLATVLDEELALLRGRDDSLLPGSRKTPVYNRLVWNYTRGISSGEAIYALNYDIKDRVWDYSLNANNPDNLPADGIISAADAAISYPQGHGDAYGHYLTALTGYYGLLTNPHFSWTPRIEAVLVLGTPVSVDYQDERKFAAAAAALARTARQTFDLTYRQQYSASEDAGWADLHDEKANSNTGITRQWGADDWACRGGMGALFHWATVHSLLPAVDPDPTHSGIQKIDRTTVPELAEIAAEAAAIQQSLDNADAHFNPLGLASGALTFDISPTDVDAGRTHFEQIYSRATAALQNAVTAFNNAKGSTQFLRQQEDTLADQRYAIQSQEQAYTNQLIELYGTPYTDDIGPGKTYEQDYAGPDLYHSMIVDVPELFDSGNLNNTASATDTDGTIKYTLKITPALDYIAGAGDVAAENYRDAVLVSTELNDEGTVEFILDASGFVQKDPAWTGRRVSPGRMQTAVSDSLIARQKLFQAAKSYEKLATKVKGIIAVYNSSVEAFLTAQTVNSVYTAAQTYAKLLQNANDTVVAYTEEGAKNSALLTEEGVEALPKSVGVTSFDSFFAGRAALLATGAINGALTSATLINLKLGAKNIDRVLDIAKAVKDLGLAESAFQQANAKALNDLIVSFGQLKAGAVDIDSALRDYDQAQRDLYALQAEGDRIQQQRLVFRQHAAALVQGYRTRDFAFRAFRDEALERYKALFDLAARYTYLAARAYDYETGLLEAGGNPSAARFFEKIVQARALGVVINGQPQFAGASTGDPGLSGVLAEMAGDWSVAKTRLGFNNPDRYRTTFSLRQENFRLIPGREADGDWRDRLSAMVLENILDDPDVRRHAMQAGGTNGLPVPGIVIEFDTTIADGHNFFGQPLAAGDHGFSPTSFATKIRSSGIAFKGYIGMDDPGTLGGGLSGIGAVTPLDPNLGFNDPNGLSATPYIYLIPAGTDSMRSPPLGDVSTVRAWTVEDQAIPLPFNIANSDYSTQPAWVSAASLSEPAFMLRKHQAFRAVPDGAIFSSAPGFTNARLIGRSVWNNRWKIVIPGNTLLSDPNKGVRIFLDTVKDIKLHFETYSYSGN